MGTIFGARDRALQLWETQKVLDFGEFFAPKYWTYTQHEEKYAEFASPRRAFPSGCF